MTIVSAETGGQELATPRISRTLEACTDYEAAGAVAANAGQRLRDSRPDHMPGYKRRDRITRR